ncbi:hypothetical protein EVAR_62740_1 [Eumeta japonica]|uniref:Uncharacterized protein n=1 Tax=Eumeta variegata TaxID=151549 RepID=A0A4C1ZB94_EUMVA|nr:hypothetical protein EVAR_62740_1 [Eumeta japonica]
MDLELRWNHTCGRTCTSSSRTNGPDGTQTEGLDHELSTLTQCGLEAAEDRRRRHNNTSGVDGLMCSPRHGASGCAWESLMKNVTLGNVTMSHRTRERPAECLASLSHSTMIGLPRAQH